MAEARIGQQRSFVKNVSRQSAQQIRESATATVKAMSEQVSRNKKALISNYHLLRRPRADTGRRYMT